jgi:Spy/CpxP family protein refolding chaperone
MSLKIRLALVGTIISAGVALPALCAEPQAQPAAHAPGLRDPLAAYKAVGINKEQEAKLQTLIGDFRKLAVAKSQEMDGMMRDMRGLSIKPDPDEAAVVAKQTQLNKLNSDMAIEQVKLIVRMRKVLTPDQKKKLVALMNGGPVAVAPVKPAAAVPKK